jgi:hypothetical protein
MSKSNTIVYLVPFVSLCIWIPLSSFKLKLSYLGQIRSIFLFKGGIKLQDDFSFSIQLHSYTIHIATGWNGKIDEAPVNYVGNKWRFFTIMLETGI